MIKNQITIKNQGISNILLAVGKLLNLGYMQGY